MKKYELVAQQLSEQIVNGIYNAGEKLPSIRRLSKEFCVSISTVQEALAILEERKQIEVKNRSGHYVKYQKNINIPKLSVSKTTLEPTPITSHQLALDLVKATNTDDYTLFGAAIPDADFLPTKEINSAISYVTRHQPNHSNHYIFPPGDPELRTQIAIHMQQAGCEASPDDIVITNGCHESICLALRAVAKPGDIIAVETPTFYGLFQAIESLGMKALEIPTDPESGINLGALEMAIEQWQISACVMVSNFNNPLGYCMPYENKNRFYDLMASNNIPIIEDDIYGDLGFDNKRPVAIKSFDKPSITKNIEHANVLKNTNENVIYCNSFSKTVSPGLRVGWVYSHKYQNQIEYLKYVSNMSTSTIAQLALARYLKHGNHNKYLRNIRMKYAHQVRLIAEEVYNCFPEGTKISQPTGGFVIWIELPEHIDALEVYKEALKEKISIAPGQIFSARKKYSNFIRLNCAKKWGRGIEDAIYTLGKIVKDI